jgi:hypothetical protein
MKLYSYDHYVRAVDHVAQNANGPIDASFIMMSENKETAIASMQKLMANSDLVFPKGFENYIQEYDLEPDVLIYSLVAKPYK